ncbi:MAG TPA: hypothetical protein PK781_05030, partial [Terrimesophilobacter sp.]|nr:hypothetical protein [Terrimesophilobacter sp.]
MKMSRRGTAGAVALTMVILLAGCSAPDIPGDETDGKTGVPNDVAADVGVDWELAETGFDEGSEVRSIATGAGRVWVEVFVEGAGCDELQLWWSADALTWQREDLAAAGIPEEALCNLGVSSFAPGPTEMSGDDDTFTFGLFLDEPMLDLLGISYTTHVRGAEWVLRFDGEIWSSHGLPGNGLLERQTLPGYWDGASTPRDSATVNGATMFVTTGGWFQEGRTTGETFHARYVDSEGVGSVIQSLGEPFLAADGEFRRSDFVTHNGTEWIVVGELGVGLDGIAV